MCTIWVTRFITVSAEKGSGKMNISKEDLVREIRDALEDVVIYQNKRNIADMEVSLSNAYTGLGITSEDLAGVKLTHSHLDADKKYRVLERTSNGLTVVK